MFDSPDQSTTAEPAGTPAVPTTPAPHADPDVQVPRRDPGVLVTKTGQARDVEAK